ncbi:MAG: PEP-CTERM sorting domain-containing protein [Phycisphaerales bacterium]|nr:PEP-CTERM sorting domain-containing protein [Phycisphaerales bacterium]MCB9862734.1 PEP-CTERM sorting domain-containing protein [Phycisphaerales bacterium]
MLKIRNTVLAAGLALLVLAGVAQAATINYGDYFGIGAGQVDFINVREASATDPYPANDPLYGAPIRDGNRLIFTPLTFASFASNGAADTTSGTLSMIIRADVGQFLTSIFIRETGDFSLLGVGTPATSATINGLLTITELAPGSAPTITSTLGVMPAAPYALPADMAGEFVATTEIDVSGLGFTEVVLNFNNNLQTTSENGTVSFIQKKTVVITVNPEIPEPATLSLLAISGVVLLRRRTRR